MNVRALFHRIFGRPLRNVGIHLCRTHKYPICTGSLLDLAVPALLPKFNDFTLFQVGASDGQTSDPLAHLIRKYDLKGVLIEPLPNSFSVLQERYRNNKRIRCVNCAVSDTEGEVSFYCPKGSAGSRVLDFQKSGLSKKSLIQAGFHEEDIEEIVVISKTLPQIIQETHYDRIHLLQIDTEGFDFEIVKLGLKLRWPPPIIHFESIHLSKSDKQDSRTLLVSEGYSLIESETDTLAYHMSALA